MDSAGRTRRPTAWRTTSGGGGGELAGSGEQVHGGGQAGKLAYGFSGPNQAIDLAPPAPVAIAGRPQRLGAWVRGDSSGNYLSAWLRDSNGALFKVRLGVVDAANAGWRLYEAPLDGYFFPWELVGSTIGTPAFPVSFVAFRPSHRPRTISANCAPGGGRTVG